MTLKKKSPGIAGQGFGVNHYEAIHMENTNAISKENNAQLGTVEFLGKPLTVIITDSQLLVAMRPICEGIGLDWKSQYERIKRDEVLSTSMVVMTTQMPGDDQKRQVTCLPLSMLNGWLFGVDSKRCKPFIRQALVRYKFECYDALAAYWQQCSTKALPSPAALPAPEQYDRITHAFRGSRVEFLVDGRQVWVKASCITTALGIGSSDRITRGLPDERKLVQVRGRQRHIFVDPAAAMRASGYVRDVERGRAWEVWLAEVLQDVGAGVQKAVLVERDLACLYAVCEAGERLVRAHQELAPVHQAMRSNALIGVGAALETLVVSARHLRKQFGDGMQAAAQRSGLLNGSSPNLLGVQLCSALGENPLSASHNPARAAPVQSELLQDGGLTAVERFGLEQLLDMRLLVSFDERGTYQAKPIPPGALLVSPSRLANVLSDPFTVPTEFLPEILQAVAARMGAAMRPGLPAA